MEYKEQKSIVLKNKYIWIYSFTKEKKKKKINAVNVVSTMQQNHYSNLHQQVI